MSDTKTKPLAERKEHFTTLSGLPIDRLYTQDDLPVSDPESSIGYPGEFPYTRGIYPTMYRGRLWTMRQYAGFGTAVESNQRYRYLLGKGQAGLSVAFDLPTQIGLDSDHPLALGEVGKVGVAIDSLGDMETLLDGIPLEKVSTSMTINATAAILLCLYIAVAKKQGANLAKISGTVQNDVLKEYIARGTYIYPVRPAMRVVTDIFAWCRDNLPKWNTISISGYHIREAGSTAIAGESPSPSPTGIAYVQAALDSRSRRRRIRPTTLLFLQRSQRPPRRNREVSCRPPALGQNHARPFSCTGPSLAPPPLPRTNRRLLPHRAATRKQHHPRSHPSPSRRSRRLPDPLHTNSLDEALALPTEDSALIALRTQQILAHEIGVTNSIDPVAGSYAIEHLTNEIEQGAVEYISKIDAMGGMLRAIESGFVQGEIQKAAYDFQRAIESKEQIIVGVNDFIAEEERTIPTLRIEPEIERSQIARLNALRAKRDSARTKSALAELQRRAATTENLLPAILTAVEAHATVGEISDTLRRIFGEYQESVVI